METLAPKLGNFSVIETGGYPAWRCDDCLDVLTIGPAGGLVLPSDSVDEQVRRTQWLLAHSGCSRRPPRYRNIPDDCIPAGDEVVIEILSKRNSRERQNFTLYTWGYDAELKRETVTARLIVNEKLDRIREGIAEQGKAIRMIVRHPQPSRSYARA